MTVDPVKQIRAERRTSPAIEVRGLRKSYLGRTVLDGIDLTVETGETLVILGGSGSGKSTLLRCMLGLERPDAGSVLLQGVDLLSAPPREVKELRQRIGMAFQGSALFGSLTLAENVDLPLEEFTRLPLSTRRIIVRIKLALVGLQDALDRYPSELSGGMQKRAAFARAMALDPDLLFCDEPSSGLDPVTAAGLDRLLVNLREVFGVTLVVVTHELQSAFAVADRLALIHRGRFRVMGTPDEVRACQDRVVRHFLDRVPEEDDEDDERYQRLIRGWESER
jgi:phospholipid/cholesterol/gamma-HCH transport system ATP-binding protein